MRNSDIHNDLPDKVIRDFLAHELLTFWDMEMANKKETVPYDRENPYDWAIQDSKNNIKFEQQKLKILELRKGITLVIANHGWTEHDVSDYVAPDVGKSHWLSFIGTDEECKELTDMIDELNGK